MASDKSMERVKPWAMVFSRVLHRQDSTLSIGELITEECQREGLDYPPPDVEEALLLVLFKYFSTGAPPPKGLA